MSGIWEGIFGGADKTTTQQTSELAKFATPHFKDMITDASKVADQAYVPYGGQRLANFSADTNKAFDMIRQQAGQHAGAEPLNRAIDLAKKVGAYNPTGISAQNATAHGMFDVQGFDELGEAGLDAYMNPYISKVLDVNKDKAMKRFQEQQVMRDSNAVNAGAFGGNRRFLTDMLANRDLNEQLDTMNAEGMSSAFDRATALWSGDQAREFDAWEGGANRLAQIASGNADRNLQGQISNEEARRMAAALGLDASSMLARFGQQQQDMGYRDAEALSAVGTKIQGRNQAALDIAYQDFLKQQNHPKDQVSWYASILSGTPGTTETTQTTTGPEPNWLSQLAGLGLSAAGIYGGLT